MVIAVVMRAEKFVCLFDQILVVVPDLLGSGECGGGPPPIGLQASITVLPAIAGAPVFIYLMRRRIR